MARYPMIGKRIASMLRAGKCARQIAEELGCRQEYVRTVAYRRGIALPSGRAYLREAGIIASRPGRTPEEKEDLRLWRRRLRLRQDQQVSELIAALDAVTSVCKDQWAMEVLKKWKD